MAQRMLQFTHLPQQTPQKREADERRADFGEIYARFDTQGAQAQSSRCSQCGIPFCSVHCPLSQQHPRLAEADGRRAA